MQTYDPSKEELITVTEGAQAHFKQVAEESNVHGIRLKLAGGGCAGFSYEWEMVNNADVRLDEFSIAFDGWSFYLDTLSKPYLAGSTVDKSNSIAGNMITISSPLADSTCGCGESVTFNI